MKWYKDVSHMLRTEAHCENSATSQGSSHTISESKAKKGQKSYKNLHAHIRETLAEQSD